MRIQDDSNNRLHSANNNNINAFNPMLSACKAAGPDECHFHWVSEFKGINISDWTGEYVNEISRAFCFDWIEFSIGHFCKSGCWCLKSYSLWSIFE